MNEMRAPGKASQLPFQKGIQQSIMALIQLREYMKLRTKGEVQYIMTNRVGQDCLERFFGYLRSKEGGLNDHPSPMELKYRLRSCILGEFTV